MHKTGNHWDYLAVTASNAAQAQAYEIQLRLRQQLGFLETVGEVLVVPDPGGKRIGSGGSTIYSLLEILKQECKTVTRFATAEAWHNVLKSLRILIIHAGGDSQRLPAYGPCGKLFIPIPGENDYCERSPGDLNQHTPGKELRAFQIHRRGYRHQGQRPGESGFRQPQNRKRNQTAGLKSGSYPDSL